MFSRLLSHHKPTISSSSSSPLLTLITTRLISTSLALSFSTTLKDYSFKPPPSLSSPNPNPNTTTTPYNKKKQKPSYKPPFSLDRTGSKPLHSDLPFDFQFSYTETSPKVRPIGLREPKYSPFGPDRIDRPWTGVCAPSVDRTVKSVEGNDDGNVILEEKRRLMREKVLGVPLTNVERKALVDKCQRNKIKRQINLGRDGLTHNMLNDVHNNWKNAEAIMIKCMGVPPVDMRNVCTQLEDKACGKIIHRQGGLLVLYRGRHYNPRKRSVIPLMLWKPHEPIYSKLIKTN